MARTLQKEKNLFENLTFSLLSPYLMSNYLANQFRQLKAASGGEESLSLFIQSNLQFTKYLQATGF